MRPAGGVMCTESFNEGVEAVYGPRWESIIPGQCCPLRNVGKTQHRITSSLVQRFAYVRKTSRCWSGSFVQSYRLRLSGFHPKGMSASITRSTKGCRRTVHLAGRCMWERLKASVVLPMCQGCDSPWVRSVKV